MDCHSLRLLTYKNEVLDLKVGIEECLSDYNTTAESQVIVPDLED